MSQTRKHSMFEAVANVLVGYGISLAAQIVIFPLFGVHASLAQNIGIGLAFTAVSLVRSYLLRRWFNGFAGRKLAIEQHIKGGGNG